MARLISTTNGHENRSSSLRPSPQVLYVFVSLFAVLLVLNAAVTRTILFPATLFSAVWAVSLFGLLISGRDFYPISLETLTVFLIGAIALSIGGIFGLMVAEAFRWKHEAATDYGRQRSVNRILNISFAAVLIGFPFYVQEMMNLAKSTELEIFVYQVRGEIVEAGRKGFSVINNLPVLANLVAIAAWYERDDGAWNRWRAYLCVIVTLAYGFLSGSKGVGVVLLLALFFVSSIQAQRVSFKAVLTAMSLLITVFAIGLLMVNYVFETVQGAEEGLAILVTGIQQYWLGGMVASIGLLLTLMP